MKNINRIKVKAFYGRLNDTVNENNITDYELFKGILIKHRKTSKSFPFNGVEGSCTISYDIEGSLSEYNRMILENEMKQCLNHKIVKRL